MYLEKYVGKIVKRHRGWQGSLHCAKEAGNTTPTASKRGQYQVYDDSSKRFLVQRLASLNIFELIKTVLILDLKAYI